MAIAEGPDRMHRHRGRLPREEVADLGMRCIPAVEAGVTPMQTPAAM
ncbi:hypothetical protein [Streptomyces sp. NPDC000351]